MIHKTALIDSNAKISKNVFIGPYSVIGSNVQIDEGTVIQSHVNITGNTIIGKNNQIYPFASIGNDPQDLKFKGEKTLLEIGHSNKIREYVSINPGTKGGGGKTKVGSNCLFTAFVIGLILVPIPPAKIIPFFIIYYLIFYEYLFYLESCNIFCYYCTIQKLILYLH